MILQALREYAEAAHLVDSMEAKQRLIHLELVLQPDGSVEPLSAWRVLTRPAAAPQKKDAGKEDVGRLVWMPEFPGVNSGGKAYFLADTCEKLFGLNGKTGELIPDDGHNASKAFHHFWQRIQDAFRETSSPELATLLAFRDRYLASEDSRRALDFVGACTIGKDAKPAFCAMVAD
ncbi:hypothetical protein ACYOEI_39245, partial [Singulisphaera rosea]